MSECEGDEGGDGWGWGTFLSSDLPAGELWCSGVGCNRITNYDLISLTAGLLLGE